MTTVEATRAQGLRLDAQAAGLMVIDFQERLAAAMPEVERIACERNMLILVETARLLRMPVVLSEQYPKGLGPTVPALAASLGAADLRVLRMEKVDFACTDSPAFPPVFAAAGRTQWILVGMEAHVCVYQTARGLVELGSSVHVPADAVISRTENNHRIGLGLAAHAGAIITSTEAVAFDLLRRAGSVEFKAVSRLVK